MAFILRTLLLSVFTAVIYCEEEFFNITRHTDKIDQFKIPPSICKRTPTQLECSRFHVAAYIAAGRCECSCPYEASTFGFVSGTWSCLKNTEFRTQAGCTYKFQSEYHGNPIKVLETGRRQQPQFIKSLPSKSCKIDFSSSTYLKCDGSWSGLGLSENSDVFQLSISGDDHGPPWYYKLKITKKASLAGRIVKLQLNCGPASKSSCILFKVAGKITCPVVPTKKSNASGGQSGASSGTTTAVVIIIILVIIVVAVIIALIIWKRRRGENVWLMDHISSIVTKVRDRSSSKVKEEEHPEQIYVEIPDQPVQQPTHHQNTPEETVTQTQTGTRTAILLSGGRVVPEEPTDDDGYAEPPDSPAYNELEDPNEQGGLGQGTDDGVPKQRRKPPSPSQKRNVTKERGLNVNDDTDVKGYSQEDNDMNQDYQSLKDDNRDVYQPLDRKVVDNR